jgi:hypothetical protein
MIHPGRPSLLSAQAEQLLTLLTPDFVCIGYAYMSHNAVRELVSNGLAEIQSYNGAIRLTGNGRAWVPSVNN